MKRPVSAGRFFAGRGVAGTPPAPYIMRMRVLLLIGPVVALLAFSLWFVAHAWTYLGGDPLPFYGWLAMAGGIVFSLLIGCGLMALMFYSARHGYDEPGNPPP